MDNKLNIVTAFLIISLILIITNKLQKDNYERGYLDGYQSRIDYEKGKS
jgi:hypothetical protein